MPKTRIPRPKTAIHRPWQPVRCKACTAAENDCATYAPPEPQPCPKGLPNMCDAIKEWAQAMECWGRIVQEHLNDLLGGGPNHVPPPPPPPFQ